MILNPQRCSPHLTSCLTVICSLCWQNSAYIIVTRSILRTQARRTRLLRLGLSLVISSAPVDTAASGQLVGQICLNRCEYTSHYRHAVDSFVK